MTPSAAGVPRERTVCLALFLLSVALNLGFSFVGFRNSPKEIHEFRQVQTALTAREIQEHGWSLAYPTPLFGPPWSAPMEFPIYEVCVAKVAAWTGLQLEPAARLVAMGFLYLALPAALGLAGLLGLPSDRRWLLPSVLLLSPVYLYYSRSIMIESTAFCAAAWFLLAYCRALERGAHRWLAGAILFGVAAALAKVTTFIVFLAVAAVFTLDRLLQLWRRGAAARPELRASIWRGLAAASPGVLIGIAWVDYTDRIKLSNPLSVFLSSERMSPFNFGSLDQRLSPEFWARMAQHLTFGILPTFNLALVAVFALAAGRESRKGLVLLLLGFAAGPAIFSNLYFVHDYYFYASAAFALAALVVGWSRLLDNPAFAPAAKWLVVAGSLGLQLLPYVQYYLPAQQRPLDPVPELGTALAAATDPDEVVLVFGQEWNSETAYFSHRRAIMVTYQAAARPGAVESVLRRVEPGRVTAMVITGNLRPYNGFSTPFTTLLKLHPTPVLTSAETEVFAAEKHLDRTIARLEMLPLRTLASPAPADGSVVPRMRFLPATFLSRKVTTMMSPQPVIILHPYGLAFTIEHGKPAFNAHAPTDLMFEIPARATTVEADFGILAAAYAGTNQTEGVEFRVEWVNQNGEHRTLTSVYLSPSRHPEDRGEKSLRARLPAGATGQLWFRTLPGPTGSLNFDWGYWSRIEIK